MAITRLSCPECAAGLKSATGFKVGQTVCCPKCETYFAVEEPDDEEEDEAPKKKSAAKGPAPGLSKTAPLGKKKPLKAAAEDEEEEEEEEKPKKKKKKKRRDEEGEGWSYRNSWIRYAILAVLITVMCVLGYMLHLKQEREKQSFHRNLAPHHTRA